MRDLYALCDGGTLSLQYQFLPLAKVESETEQWRTNLHDYWGDGKGVLVAGQHVVLASDSGGAPVIWDATGDRLASFFWKGGDWEPYDMGFEEFMESLFNHPERVSAGQDLWSEAMKQLREME